MALQELVVGFCSLRLLNLNGKSFSVLYRRKELGPPSTSLRPEDHPSHHQHGCDRERGLQRRMPINYLDNYCCLMIPIKSATRNYSMEYSYHNGEKFVISKKLFENDRRGEPESKIIEPDSSWTSKLRAYHELLDVNNDGIVSVEDLKELTKRFSKVNNMTEKQSSIFGGVIENLWYKHWGCIDPFDYVTVEKYMNYIQYVQQNNGGLKNEVVQLLPYLFKAVDADQSGDITQEEYDKFLECMGTSNKKDLIKFLGIINEKNNTIKVDEVKFIVHKHLFQDKE